MERLSESDALLKESLALALVGDAVWTLYVRKRLILAHDYKSGKLSRLACDYVNAAAQCKMLYAVEGLLTEPESDVCRRARNAHTGARAKNASLDEYKKASGLEALFGYLYLTGQGERLREIEEICFNNAGGGTNDK
ncbi:MAG: Mini-ribonuclease 3 [Firmicutes bacterium]|nr:Mini-ribonuclease 3 [Bacillota bacterium]